ncbi:hypothetical protein GIS00_21025 [Nakamurella sp. YIM 132087]|uniref:MFS transporter n=1 Tax=Nakamurella alba TaxID=2665158 RepID=A0A7K1FTC3_9ACTN|nr:hypothetical protein [Nakamurella alba]MTD16423.1 hypothetical protein [Nakamurella alba]
MAIAPLNAAIPGRFRAVSATAHARWVCLAFCLVIAGPNLPTALLPVYRESFGTGSFGLSLLFSTYLLVLVPLLLIGARPRIAVHSRPLLLAGLAVAVTGDIVMELADSTVTAGVGRALSGISVALSTGAAASLVVGMIGDRGRGSVASGNVIGGVLGTGLAVLLAALGAAHHVYLWHAGVTAAVLAVLAVLAPPAAVRPVQAAGAVTTLALPAPRHHRVLALVAGAIAWSLPGLVLGLLPALLRERDPGTGILGATASVLTFLAAAWALSVLAPRLRWLRGYELTAGTTCGAVGAALLAAAALLSSLPLAHLGAVLAAAAPAVAYRGAMVLFTRGVTPTRQSTTTSLYAGVSYGVSAVVVLGAGALGLVTGLPAAVAAAALLLTAAGLALVVVLLVTARRDRR